MIKYLLCPGYIRSKEAINFITSKQLIECYGVNANECITNSPEHTKGMKHDLIKLYPRESGDYKIGDKDECIGLA